MVFQLKVIAGIATACGVMLVVALLSYAAATRNDEHMFWVNHTHLVLENLEEAQGNVSDAEAFERGYILTADTNYLTQYRQYVGRLNDNLKQIGELTVDNPAQQTALTKLDQSVRDKLASLDERIGIRTDRGLQDSVVVLQSGVGNQLMGDIRDGLSGMKAEEQRLLVLRSNELEKSSRRIRGVILIGNVLGFLFMAGSGIIVHEEMKRRAAAETVIRVLNTELEARVVARTAELADRARDLERSNTELQQFAYVASHDLQEPLRTISSFTQLLAKRYRDRLDDKAREFIDFAVDGCKRMQVQINDLLAFSRVGTQGKPLVAVSCDAALDRVLKSFKVALDESQAVITRDFLPVVLADEIQLCQLLQNLIGNAMKFKGADVPRIHVSAVPDPLGWKIAVRDSGIGIAPEHGDRVFVIFQRLHTKTEYPGTGIGLAICKKIAERHGGRIWYEPTPGGGTTFYFTLQNGKPNPTEAGSADELRYAGTAH
jgi:signal transduction histidine kinase